MNSVLATLKFTAKERSQLGTFLFWFHVRNQKLEHRYINAWHNESRQQIEFHTNYNKSYATEENLIVNLIIGLVTKS